MNGAMNVCYVRASVISVSYIGGLSGVDRLCVRKIF